MLSWLLLESINGKHLIQHCVQISCSCYRRSPLRSLFRRSPANLVQHFIDICSRVFPEGTLPFIQQLFLLFLKLANLLLQALNFTFIAGYTRPNSSFEPVSYIHRFEFQLAVLVQLSHPLTFS